MPSYILSNLISRTGGTRRHRIVPQESALKDLLSGTWLGRPLHPMLTDVVIGVWTSASVLDILGGKRAERAAGQGFLQGGAGRRDERRVEPAGYRDPLATDAALLAAVEGRLEPGVGPGDYRLPRGVDVGDR